MENKELIQKIHTAAFMLTVNQEDFAYQWLNKLIQDLKNEEAA